MPSSKAKPRRARGRTASKRPPQRPRDSTLDEVARSAGVSSATVSRYFNSPLVVAAPTAVRISEAVRRHSYVPNLLAGGLASNRTRLIAAVIPTLSQSIFASTIQALTDALADAGYSVMLALSGAADEHVDRQLLSIIGRRPDGIILTGALQREARNRLRRTGIPTIETWDLPADPIDLVVGFSHEAVGCSLAAHALQSGRRRSLIISATGMRAGARRRGFAGAMREHGAPEPVVASFEGPTTYRVGRSAVASHFDGGARPELIVCSSDWSAHGALDELRQRGVRVPDEVAVVGFGDLDFAAGLVPSLTSVKIDGAVIGQQAAAFLMLRAQGKIIAEPVVDVGFSLVVRDSG